MRTKAAASVETVTTICKQRIGFAWIFAFIATLYICALDRASVPWESRISAEMGPGTDDAEENLSGAGG